MKNRLLRLLSFALVLGMILGTLPVSVYATGKDSAPMRSSGGFSVGNSGRYVIAANVDGVYYALSNTFSGKILGAEIPVIDGYVSEEAAADFALTLSYDGSNYTIQNDTHYLSYASSTNLGASSSAYSWSIGAGKNGSWRITATTATTRGIVFRAKDYLQFGAYALSNAKEGSTEYYDVEILPIGSVAGATEEKFVRVTSKDEITSGRYIFLAAPTQSASAYSYYALTKCEDTSYYAVQMTGTSLTTLPTEFTASEDLIWTLEGTAASALIGGNDGNYLYNDPYAASKLQYTNAQSYWTLSYYSAKSAFTLKSTYYMSFRDDSTYIGDNGLPLSYCASSTNYGNPYFYVYKSETVVAACAHVNKTTDSNPATCTADGSEKVTCKDCGKILSQQTLPATGHSFKYASNLNGTHNTNCSKCDYTASVSCTMFYGKCSFCGWSDGSVSVGTFQLVTAANQITDGSYVLVVAPGGANPGSYPYYAISRQMHSTSYVMAEGLDLSQIPQELSVPSDLMIWNLSGNSTGFTLSGAEGSVLYNSNNNLYYKEGTATVWTPTFENGTFILNADTRYLGLRDDLATVDSNGNPCFRCNTSAKTTSYQFYLFKSGELANPECSHKNTTTSLSEASCTEDGLLTTLCSDCGSIVSTEVVSALGHNATYVEGVPAGCKTNGSIPHYVCSRCKLYFSDPLCRNEIKASALIVAPVGHDLVAVGAIEATCGTEGMMAHYTCNACNAYFLDANGTNEVGLTDLTIPAVGHTLVEIPAVPASCAAEGNIAYFTCEDCNMLFSDQSCETEIHLEDTILPALNHTLSFSPVVEASCTQSGVYAYYYCSICDIYYSDDEYTETITENDLIIPPLGHDILFTNRIEPACTESGIIAHYYCDRCHVLFRDAAGKETLTEDEILIDATGHNYIKVVTPATCTTAGSEDYTCSACNDFYSTPIPATGHTYVNGICTQCGQVGGNIDSTITINHTLNLASDISINFAVKAALLSAYDSYYLECKVPVYSGNTLQSYNTVIIQPVMSGSYYYFTLTGITAVQIGDEVQATLHMSKAGTQYISSTDYYSVAEYAYSQLNKDGSTAKLNTLCANLLQYGASAQTYKSYRTNAYADAAMTTVHKSYLTSLDTVTFQNHNRSCGDLNSPAVTWQGKSLNLDSKITVKYVINVANYNGNIEDLNLRISYMDYNGVSKSVILKDIEKYGTNANWYSFDFDGLLAAELRQVLSAAVYEDDVRVSETLEYSIDSYGNGKTGNLLTVCKAMVAYSDSALAYFKS